MRTYSQQKAKEVLDRAMRQRLRSEGVSRQSVKNLMAIAYGNKKPARRHDLKPEGWQE